MIIFVGAHDQKHGMGYNDHLPWTGMQADVAHFHDLTHDKIVAMGERTYREYKSIQAAFGDGPKYIISRSKLTLPDATSATIDDIITLGKTKDVWVTGGGTMFKLLIDHASKMYITEIDGEFKADTFFPDYSKQEWQEIKRQSFEADDKNPYPYTFIEYQRRT